MRSLAVAAGLCVAAGYLLGSVPVAYLLGRGLLRRDMRTFTDGHRTGRPRAGTGRPVGLGSPAVAVGALDAALSLVAATVAWRVVAEVAPGRGDPSILAGVAAFSDQVLVPWQSVALWTGLAAVVGGVVPVWLGLRGGWATRKPMGEKPGSSRSATGHDLRARASHWSTGAWSSVSTGARLAKVAAARSTSTRSSPLRARTSDVSRSSSNGASLPAST